MEEWSFVDFQQQQQQHMDVRLRTLRHGWGKDSVGQKVPWCKGIMQCSKQQQQQEEEERFGGLWIFSNSSSNTWTSD
jgi:hypothetical protein